MKNKSLDFVARYYRHGALDISKAYRKTLAKACGSQKPQSSILKPQIRWVAAAAIAMLLVAGAIVLFRPSVTTLAAIGTNKTFVLQDGTVVTLAPHSTLSYKGDCREVELTGKAYLNIHHDAGHPFMIKDKSYVIKDIGTRLMVDEAASRQPSRTGEEAAVSVYVDEGSVSFASTSKRYANIVLHKGQGATINGNGQPKRMAQPSQNITTWATHEFHFAGTPLPEVLRDLSAYYGVSLSCQSADGKRLTADFHADSLQTIVSMIEETLDVKIKTE